MDEQTSGRRVDRRTLLSALGAAPVGGSVLFAGCAGDDGGPASTSTTRPAETYANPLYEPHFPDPAVLQAPDGTYYAYGTNMKRDDIEDERLITVLESEDLVEWTYVGEAFEERPGWTLGSLWAPDVHRYDGTYYLFYSLRTRPWDDPDEPWGIGVATADTPEGLFTDHSASPDDAIISDDDTSTVGLIDPYFLTDGGTPYLLFGSFDGIYGVELTEDATARVEGTRFQVAGTAYEGTVLHRRGDYYYLFLACGSCCSGFASTYEVHVGRSASLTGPYVNRWGRDLLDIDMFNSGLPTLAGSRRFPGPGHGDVVTYGDGSDWFAYHAYDGLDAGFLPTGPPRRVLMLDRIAWTDDGWPVIGADGQPSEESAVPGTDRYPPASDDGRAPVSHLTAGTYRLVNRNSGKALEVADGSTADGANVQQWEPTGAERQQWTVAVNDDGTSRLENVASGKVLAPRAPESRTEGATLVQRAWSGARDQRWKVIVNADGTYRLVDLANGFAADVLDLTTADGGDVIQWGYWGGDNQKWAARPV